MITVNGYGKNCIRGVIKKFEDWTRKKNQHQRRLKETFRYRHKLIQKKKSLNSFVI